MTSKIPKEKVAVITAAVTSYIAGLSGSKTRRALPLAPAPTAWALAGRREAMQTRLMMQRRIVR
jgi:hypothetical protein